MIYLDYAATTPVDPRVAEKMMQYLTGDGEFGNPASTHAMGQAAKEAIEAARLQVADCIAATPEEIIWTSGATESNNLALKGAAHLYQRKGKHIITVKTEHPSVLDSCQQLEKEGFSVTYLTPQKNGVVALEAIEKVLRDDTMLVSIMHVNNEIGVIQDISAIAHLISSRCILLHVDAVQSAGKIDIDLSKIPVDLMSFSAHKIYGPKGIGALYVRKKPRVRVAAQIHGGGQEQGMRSGTLATHQIVGMGEAFYLAKKEREIDATKMQLLREQFWQGVKQLENVHNNSDFTFTIPNIINLRFDGIKADALIKAMPTLAISSGSACLSKGIEPSYVLRALGQSNDMAASAVRFSLGRFTTQDEISSAVSEIVQAVKKLL
jgi:cysteine desulfurase